MRDSLTKSLALAEFKMRPPRTQRDCCGIVARVSITTLGYPKSEHEIIARAHGLAVGLFGKAYVEADDCQRLEWDEMCEIALREAIETF